MGVNLPKDQTIAGFSLVKVKQAVIAYSRTGSEGNFMELKSLAPSRPRVAALYHDLVERKLIDPNSEYLDDRVTEAGLAIAGGKAKRVALSKAQAIIDELLDRVQETNENASPLRVVDRIWLFGSVMRGADDVGDIDLAIEQVRNPLLEDESARERRFDELRRQAPDHLNMVQRMFWHGERCIFGDRRHPLLAGAHIGADDLVEMGVPCQLIFDRARGGRVNDPIIPRHPDSKGRSNDMPEPRVLPDLSAPTGPLAPMDARWLSAYHPRGKFYKGQVFPKSGADIYLPGHEGFVFTGHEHKARQDWDPRLLKEEGLDGVVKAVLKVHDSWRDPRAQDAAALLLGRDMRQPSRTSLAYTLSLTKYERPRGMRAWYDVNFLYLCGMSATLAAGDICRQISRWKDQGISEDRSIFVKIEIDLPTHIQEGASPCVEGQIRKMIDLIMPDALSNGISLVFGDAEPEVPVVKPEPEFAM